MDWSIFSIARGPDGGSHLALIALRTKELNFEEERSRGQHESIQNGVRKCLPALHHQGGEEGSYEGGGACHHPLAHGLRRTDAATADRQEGRLRDFLRSG